MIPVVAGSNPVRHPNTARLIGSAPIKAEAIALGRHATVEQAFRAVVRAALVQIEANIDGVRHASDLEFVHQMRVGMRRFRSSLIGFRATIPRDASAPIWLELRDAARSLGTARDWDVLSRRVAAAAQRRFSERQSLESLLRHVLRRRAATVHRIHRAIDAGDVAGALRRASRWLENAAWRGVVPAAALGERVTPFARKALKRLLKKTLDCADNATALEGSERHRLRIRVKRLRYNCEFFAALYPRRRTKSFIRCLEGLQDTLGELNDIAISRRLLGHGPAVPSTARRAIAAMHARDTRLERRLLTDLDAQWKALKSAEPFW